MSRRAALGLLLALAAFTPAPASAQAPAGVPAEVAPEILVVGPWQGIPKPVGRDEEGLWAESDEMERQLAGSARRLKDPALEAHVRGVLCQTVGADRCRDVRVYLMRVPMFNASMLPNGAMEVWTGLLFRTASDDELAAVLGHEFAHFERRHSLAGYQRARRNTDAAVWLSMLGVPLVPEMFIVGWFGFSREQEREADLLGLAYLKQAGWPEDAAARLWQRLVGEARATASGRGQNPDRLLKSGLFDTHPGMRERAAYLAPGSSATAGARPDSVKALRAALRPHWGDILADQLGRNDFAGTDYVLEQLNAILPDADLLYARGELYRRRGHPRDLETAAALFGAALALPGARPEVARGLGLVELRAGRRAAGQCHLAAYLAARPEAPDAAVLAPLVKDMPPCP